jgi:hypothetical protein
MSNPQHLSTSVELYTPTYIVEAVRTVLGGIDLDPASCALAQEVVAADAWYGPGTEYVNTNSHELEPIEDGLSMPWHGRVFLNPPGGRVPKEYAGCGTKSNAALWWGALASQWQSGDVEAAIFVGFTLEILRSAQALDVPQPLDFPLCVPSKRIAFDTAVGYDDRDGTPTFERVPSKSPTHANVIVYLPPVDVVERDDVGAMMRQGVAVGHAAKFVDAFKDIGRCRV